MAWEKNRESETYKRYLRLKKARELRIDKEVNGWPEDPVERAKCPRLKLRLPNEFECNAYIKNTTHSLVYVANESCPELEELMENHMDVLKRWAEPLELEIIYLPTIFKTVQDKEIQKYRMPWADDIATDDMEVGNDYMFRFLIHPEDRERMKHGFYFNQTYVRSDHYVDTYICHYYELVPPSEVPLEEQLERIRIRLSEELGWLQPYFPCIRKDTMGEEPENFADNEFNSQVYSEDISDLMDEVRERVEKLRRRGVAEHLLMELIHPPKRLSRLVVTQDYRILLPDYQNMEIEMEPLVKAVYLLFLRHEEGLRFKDLPDYREELTAIYMRLKPGGLTDRARKSIEDVTNPLLNSINEKCARIRGTFLARFDNSLAHDYYIDGMRGNKKCIKLPRELVTWE